MLPYPTPRVSRTLCLTVHAHGSVLLSHLQNTVLGNSAGGTLGAGGTGPILSETTYQRKILKLAPAVTPEIVLVLEMGLANTSGK